MHYFVTKNKASEAAIATVRSELTKLFGAFKEIEMSHLSK